MPFVEDDVLSGVHHSITKALSLGKSDSTSYRYACHVMTRLPVQQSEQITKHIQELKKLMQEDSTGAFVLPRETVVLLERLHKDSFAADAEVVLEIILSSPQSHTVMSSEFISRLCTSFLGLNSEALIHWFLHDGRGTSTARMSRWKSYTTYARNNTDLGLLSKTLLPMISGADTSDPGMLEEALILLTELAHLHVDLVDKCGIKPDQLLEVIWRLGRLMDFTVLLALFRALMTQDSHQLVRALQTSVWQQVTQTSADSIPIQQLYDLFDCTHCFKMPTDVFVQDSDAALKVILPGALPKELTIVDPLGVLSHMIPKTMENFTASLTFDLQGLSTYFRICYVLKRSGNHYSDRIQMNLLIAEALLQAKRQHPAANMVTDNNLEKLDQSGLFSNWENQTSTFIDHAATILVEGGSDKESTNSMFEALGCASAVTTLHWYETSVFYRILAKAREREISAAEAETVYDLCSKDLFFHVACALALNNALFNVKGFSFQRNKIASDLTGTIQEVKSATALVKLNSHLSQDVERTTAIPRQRLILLVKNLLGYSTVHELSAFLAYEILTLLLHVLPDVASEYGSFWQSAIDVLHKVLQLDTGDISSQYSALKLAAWLWTSYESNDDLSEFWINAQPRTEILIAQSFMSIASRPRDNQASTVCSLIASRLMRKVRTSAIDHSMSTSLSALISDSAEHVQLTAYVVLSKLVDREREETILSSALAKEYEEISAAFPPELLSIALDPAIEEHDIYDHFGPLNTSQRGYFMAWVMIFRFFKDTPLRMRVKLISDLDEADLIEPLLAVIFAIMKLLDDVPADVNPYSKTELDLELVVQEGNEMLAYAAHLYYACLTHVPALVRAWWIDCKDRRLSTAVEQLTVKHYSLTLIQHDVQTLQSEQSKSVLKDDNLTVRISNGGRDIFTTYEIDEQNMEMAIRLPPNYPLRRVAVEGIQRVGVKDTVWRAWLFGSQAVLTAQNGSVLDAISLFQRNVSLHFEGVAECNICFSVLSVQDKSLPSKKCQTCKNLFHSSCLFKWFKSSSQSRCPLCRTSFAF
ncbi:E3 ubiquitin-protein ligase listerin [Taphrina deformans PYCC 5710]|uniref:E3 ubiquitin-protein ligase listerin n=1 Tax=Taphrina deformans (strain PYCC 5710 / ATCC 11124 / CBS 356.35 / IMI 108563 / JCM 9778 / NBRC 8474) TaxID=1097556 RepID=R4XBJ1_TAPDE|nr:E3 ubiquitin-protein ligase listerin [Taphrina deformans PYCC 5710]|eukprot:CCG81741.1 E3 ubiquitin-protein ligase listerin [Taphrina deformans PYCC 5710]